MLGRVAEDSGAACFLPPPLGRAGRDSGGAKLATWRATAAPRRYGCPRYLAVTPAPEWSASRRLRRFRSRSTRLARGR
jgi:hypothetical protein